MNETRQILESLARLETKLDFHHKSLVDYEKRITSLEKKWLTALGAALLSISAYIRALFE